MSRQALRFILFAVFLGISWLVRQSRDVPLSVPVPAPAPTASRATVAHPASQTWGRIESLPDHFARHGHDFQARNAEDYAGQAAAFLERARTSGLPAKRDADGSLRIYDPATGAFGAYNADGTTRTFFKPGSPDYFERQPGTNVDLRSGR
jgi:pyocin large subunit-like protein